MKTIKLPYSTNEDLTPILKQYSSMLRFAYNRFLEGKSEKEIRFLSKSLSNIKLLNSWMVQCAIREAKGIKTKFKDKIVIFGGKKNFLERLNNKITKEEFQKKRLSPISIQGEKLQKGNRSFRLDIIENNRIIFKLNKKKHLEFKLPFLKNNYKRDLFRLQELNEQEGYTYTVKFDLKHIYISFEEFKNESVKLLKTRYIGIDMNPDSIGISVLDDGKILHTQEFSLKPIFQKIFEQKLSSDSKQMKHFQSKLQFETIEIAKQITKIAKHFRCQTVFIEDLSFKGKSHSKKANRKNKNLWKKELFVLNLTKRLSIEHIDIHNVNPAYSSFIGNMQYDFTDPINASIEIGRRGYEYKIKKNLKSFYPILWVKNQWKEEASKQKDWKEFFKSIKNMKLKYRVSLDDVKKSFDVFKQSSYKSLVFNYIFYG